MPLSKKFAEDLLGKYDIQINGDRPWDIQVHDDRLYARILRGGSLALGESYVDGWWDCDAIDQFITHIITIRDWAEKSPSFLWYRLTTKLRNEGRKGNAFSIGKDHYDIGNDIYEAMLDERLTYTCGYWSGNPPAKNLAEAQEAKLDLVCKKIGLEKGMRVLDIGCGWGSFAKFAAEKYGVHITGITVSKEQIELGKKLCVGLPVDLQYQDYRDTEGMYDRIVSLGMFEHVGYKNYGTFFTKVGSFLKKDGLFLLHTIGENYSTTHTDPWLHKYIFPTGMLPSIAQIGKGIEHHFVLEDLQNFGADYVKTLHAWHQNFIAAWPHLEQKYGKRFFRMWTYYLLISAGAFTSRTSQLWQIVLSPKGIPGGYRSIR